MTVKPIRLISGKSPFCETFLDNVRVEKDQLVGEINRGWELATYLLTHEREMIGSIGQSNVDARLHPQAIAEIGLVHGQLADSALRTDIARWEMDHRAFELTAERITDEATAGHGVGAASSMLKYAGTEINKRRHELLVAIHGQRGLVWEGEAYDHGILATQWLRTGATPSRAAPRKFN